MKYHEAKMYKNKDEHLPSNVGVEQ